MQYFITFLEGLISFISPCMLPMLPLYISYFAVNTKSKTKVFVKACSFVLGFTVVFCLLGLFAGTIGSFLNRYRIVLNIVCGVIVIIFGLNYLEVIRLPFFKGMKSGNNTATILQTFVFGVIYSVSLTPCIGAFLGSALMLASVGATSLQGVLLLLCYSLGLGIPFVISALLLDKINGAFVFIKKHYKVINTVCGIFLIILGVLMALGLMNALLALMQ